MEAAYFSYGVMFAFVFSAALLCVLDYVDRR